MKVGVHGSGYEIGLVLSGHERRISASITTGVHFDVLIFTAT
jgi:hypothetical protein